jgi:hypothetical protein
MEPSAAKTKMAVAKNSEMAARMVSGCVASSLRPTVNPRRPVVVRAAVLIST